MIVQTDEEKIVAGAGGKARLWVPGPARESARFTPTRFASVIADATSLQTPKKPESGQAET